jgi:glycerophosphoryl diester phosphodiesterase
MSPAQLHQFGITGLDYTAANYRNNPSWVTSARSLGMTTNVWTINSEAEIIEMNNMDIDYITTDNPVAAARILKYYEDAQ